MRKGETQRNGLSNPFIETCRKPFFPVDQATIDDQRRQTEEKFPQFLE